jgi:hypothetical protein
LALCVFCLGTSRYSSATESPRDLGPGEAFVIVKVIGDVKSLTFQRFQGANTFVADRHSGGRIIRVPAGRYYLKNVTPVHQTIRLVPNEEPAEPSQTIAVRAGFLNYIGDWKFIEDQNASDVRYNFELKFVLETVTTVVKKHSIPSYGLMVSKLGEPPIKTTLPISDPPGK